MNIYKIALTGGPCAGKTTVLNGIKELLEKDGYYVVTVPETATYLIKNGAPPLDDHAHALWFQELVLEFQLAKEETKMAYCKNTLKTNPEFFKNAKGIVVICDRGVMDNRAYLSQEEYDKMIKCHNLNELELLYSYDLVIDLISLATTNPELYELDGIRYENAKTASVRDVITSSAWLLHPNLRMVKPTPTMDEKIELVHELILSDINKQNIEVMDSISTNELGIELEHLNHNNSKTSTKTHYFINSPNNQRNLLIKTTYQEHEIYTMNAIPQKNISREEYLSLLNLGLLVELYEETIIDFIINGCHYRTIKSDGYVDTFIISNTNKKKISNTKTLKKTSGSQNNVLI